MELGLNLSLLYLLQYLFLVIGLVICFMKWHFFTTTSSSSPKKLLLPPSPPTLPIIGNLHRVIMGSNSSLPHRSLQCLSQKYGPLMMLRFGSKPVLVASSSETAREILKNHDVVFSSRPKSRIFEKLIHGALDVAFAPYGEYWRELKSICVLHLLSNKRVQSFHQIREEETTRLIEKIGQKSLRATTVVINLSELLVTLTNDFIIRVTIGRRLYSSCEETDNNNYNYYKNSSNTKVVEMIRGFGEVLGYVNIADYIPWMEWINDLNGFNAKVERVRKDIDESLDDIIRKKEEDKDGTTETRATDFVDILLDVQRRNLTTFPLEQGTIKAVLLDMIAAGTETTLALMDWVMVELLRHPKIMEKLQTEIRQAVLVRGKTQVTEDDLPRMPYLKAVIKETLRLHAPVPLLVPHESTEDVKVMGYDISAGTQVLINVWAIGRDPNIWEEAEEFRAERFLNSNIDFRGVHFELLPFGAGRRSCPGISFAVAVSELALARLLHSFNFSLPIGVKPEEMDVTESSWITGRRKHPLLVHVSPYSS